MDQIFSELDLATLESKMWWVACNDTPFMVRFGTINNSITNLRTMWATKINEEKLLKDKRIYAKTLEVRDTRELIGLFEGILTNPEQKALYKFIKKSSGDLGFEIEKEIEVYPFTWKFELIEIECDLMQMICKDIINPLVRAFNAQEKRSQILRKRFEIMEKEFIKNLKESDKAYYKSPLLEDEQDLKLLVESAKEEEFIADLKMEPLSKFFFQNAMLGSKIMKPLIEKGDRNMKVEKKIVKNSNETYNADEILNELEMKKEEEMQKKKKKGKIDFI